MTESLKPCPFCGGEAETDANRGYRMMSSGNIGRSVAVYCANCSCDLSLCCEDIPDVKPDVLLNTVIENWNTRHLSAEREAQTNAAKKWCSYCKNDTHFDIECGSTRPNNPKYDLLGQPIYGAAPTQPPARKYPHVQVVSPFDNCKFIYCDLPGQCQSEGKCHHPKPPTQPPALVCPVCRGNDGDAPCAYPSQYDHTEGCLRAIRLNAAKQPPFPGCAYQHCDLPGQCIEEGACHHPLLVAPPPEREGDTPRTENLSSCLKYVRQLQGELAQFREAHSKNLEELAAAKSVVGECQKEIIKLATAKVNAEQSPAAQGEKA